MKYLLTFCCVFFALTAANAQFEANDEDLMILVSDGTSDGKHSKGIIKSNIPESYDQVDGAKKLVLDAPIRSLGMTDCIQAAAFLERPTHGILGYMLIFSVNDSIGGKQANITMSNGQTYSGVYRLIRQKTSAEEAIPAGMTTYSVSGTFFLLGMS